MSVNKRGLNFKLYIGIILGILATCVVILAVASKISVHILDACDEKYMKNYMEGEKGFISPWYEDGFHIVDEFFIDELSKIQNEKNIFVYGSSLSAISIDKTALEPEDGYNYRFFVCGNGCHRSNIILDNLVRKNHKYNKTDIVKYEISFSTFRYMDNSITETVLDKWGKYSCDSETLEISENSKLLSPLYKINTCLIKIQNVWEHFSDWFKLLGYKEPKAPGNYKNNYFDYNAVAESCMMDDSMKETVQNQIINLNGETTLLVEISPLPNGLLETEYGRTLNDYIDDELIPLLNENEIKYIDLRSVFEDEDFGDGVHLGYDASLKYTEVINAEINNIIRGE